MPLPDSLCEKCSTPISEEDGETCEGCGCQFCYDCLHPDFHECIEEE